MEKKQITISTAILITFVAHLTSDISSFTSYKGLIRLKAEVIRQLNEFQFQGQNAGVTTSRMGVPRFWLQTGQFDLTNVPKSPSASGAGLSFLNEDAGDQEFDRHVESRNNLLFLGSVPVFYWP